jgi:hypothetical protein
LNEFIGSGSFRRLQFASQKWWALQVVPEPHALGPLEQSVQLAEGVPTRLSKYQPHDCGGW